METTTDAINEGLARYLWPERNMQIVRFDGHAWMDEVTEYGASTHPVLLFTDSLDACSQVADKLAPEKVEFSAIAWPIGDVAFRARILLNRRWFSDHGPTRSHAWAAALWAAVREGQE